MRGNWPTEVVRVLENWALWLLNDKRPVCEETIYPAYNLAARGPRAGNVIPVLSVDAERADRIIVAMVHRYQHPLRMHYLWTIRSDESRARACNCSINTYKDRVNEAHRMFEREWYGPKVPIAKTVALAIG